MRISRDYSLENYNTFGFPVKAKQFVEVNTEAELKEILQQVYASEIFLLGGGSNILLTRDLDSTVLFLNLKGKEVTKTNNNEVHVIAAAGENWHEFVNWCLSQNFGGIENLSLIPGNVGTAPIQNIGAYGVELKDVFVSCEALHIQTLEKKTFLKEDCQFGYRNSVFKNHLKGQYIITSVKFALTKNTHKLHTGYGAIQKELEAQNLKNPSIQDVARAVVSIREQKLPNPKEIGNSGSFFKNPIVDKAAFDLLSSKNPAIPFYKISENSYKIPAGWLIDQCGLKGYREGDAGVHKKQALVLVNYGNASGKDILSLSRKIQKQVYKRFKIELEPEVNIIA